MYYLAMIHIAWHKKIRSEPSNIVSEERLKLYVFTRLRSLECENRD